MQSTHKRAREKYEYVALHSWTQKQINQLQLTNALQDNFTTQTNEKSATDEAIYSSDTSMTIKYRQRSSKIVKDIQRPRIKGFENCDLCFTYAITIIQDCQIDHQ